MAELKPVYLICGDDDAKIDAWRLRVRRRAEEEQGPGGLEAFDARTARPEEVAASLAALTFASGVRYLLVDEVGAWRAAQLEPLTAALADMPPDTVLILVVRGKPLKQLTAAVERAGGELREYLAPKPWELPRWVSERAREHDLQLDQHAARELVAAVGQGQRRLTREIEKLALAVHPTKQVSAGDVERLVAGDAPPQAYELADSLLAGDLRRTLALAEALESHGERPGALVWRLAGRLREVHRAAALLEAGVPEQGVAERIDRRPWVAKRVLAAAKKVDAVALERALCVLAQLEVELRGGGHAPLDEQTAFSLALARAAS